MVFCDLLHRVVCIIYQVWLHLLRVQVLFPGIALDVFCAFIDSDSQVLFWRRIYRWLAHLTLFGLKFLVHLEHLHHLIRVHLWTIWGKVELTEVVKATTSHASIIVRTCLRHKAWLDLGMKVSLIMYGLDI